MLKFLSRQLSLAMVGAAIATPIAAVSSAEPYVWESSQLPGPSVNDCISKRVEFGQINDLMLCDCSCSECNSPWVFRGGAIFLHRADPNSPSFGLPTAELEEFGWAGGPDIFLSRRLNASYFIEARHFNVTGWNYNSLVRETSGVDDDFLALDYGSKFYSTEINLRRQYSRNVALLLGFRWIELHESFSANAGSANGSVYDIEEGVNVSTGNYLYGCQAGVDAAIFRRGPFQIDGYGKAGIFGNHATNSASSFDIGGPVGTGTNRGGQVAFVGDATLTGTCHLTDRILLRAGYQLIWIEGVALANEQFGLNVASSFEGINSHDGLFYHGALVAVEVSF